MATNDWTEAELTASVEAYLAMQARQQLKESFTKKEVYRALADRFGRTSKAFEYRMQNISYVLSLLQRPWISGLPPAKNVGTNVAQKIEEILAKAESRPEIDLTKQIAVSTGFEDKSARSAGVDLNSMLRRGRSVASVLEEAGMKPADIKTDRHFASNWAWDDGEQAFVTIWIEDLRDPKGVPKWSILNPRLRDDLSGQRLIRAQELFNVLVQYAGRPVRVILQKMKEDPSKWSSGVAEARGFDATPWFPEIEGDAVLLQRGSSPQSKSVSVDGSPMPSRPPSQAIRETRPEQAKFRQRVAAKTGNRCALTAAPQQVCDAAHFPWVNWRTDNEAQHGILLRRDLHAALDCGLLGVEASGRVSVSAYLASSSDEYRRLHGLSVPVGGG